jgi:hypothetical protein
MPIYQTDDGTIVVHGGFGDLGFAAAVNREGVVAKGALGIRPVPPGPIGHREDLGREGAPVEWEDLPIVLAFECVESLDVFIEAFRRLRDAMTAPAAAEAEGGS